MAGSPHLTRRIRRSAKSMIANNQSSGFFDLNAIFRRASELSKLQSLSVTTSSPSQALIWPVNLGALPQSLKQLRVTSRHCTEAIICNHALPLLLPNLELLHLKTEVNLDSKSRDLPLWNLPTSLISLEVFTTSYFMVDAQDLGKLPPKLSHLGLRCMLQTTPGGTGNIAMLLRRYPLRHLALESIFASAPNIPIVIPIAFLPPTLSVLQIEVPHVLLDFLACNMKEYLASQAYQESYDCTIDAKSLLESGELNPSVSEHAKIKFAWKEIFPTLSSLHLRQLNCDFDCMQLFPPTLTDFYGFIPGPVSTHHDNGIHAAAIADRPDSPFWLSDNESVRNMAHFTTFECLHYSPATISHFRSLRSLSMFELSIRHAMVGKLPETLETLRVRDVLHIDALPDGLIDLDCSKLETPHNAPLQHRGLPPFLKSLRVSQYIGHAQIAWLPSSLTLFVAQFANADAWLALTPSHSRWHKLYHETPAIMSRSHPCEKLPTTATNVDFLPNLVYLQDLAERTSLPSCLDLPRKLETLLLNISSSSASHNFWGGFGKLESLRSLRLNCHKERLASFFKRLPRNLTRLECVDPTWVFSADDLSALPQNLKTLIINKDLGMSYPPSDNLKRSSLFDPMMAKALPRALETLKWASKPPRMTDDEIARFVDALPPTISFICVEPTVDHFYVNSKPIYGGTNCAIRNSLYSRLWKVLLVFLSIVTAHMLFRHFAS